MTLPGDTSCIECQVQGVLTPSEASRLIQAAETRGFEHQGSRGAAFGEVQALLKHCERFKFLILCLTVRWVPEAAGFQG